MKKIILITIVCLLTPCFVFFDQASASDFSIEGTLWRVKLNGVYVTLDPLNVEVGSMDAMMGIWGAEVFTCVPGDEDTCTPDIELATVYIDSPVLSLAYNFASSTEPGEEYSGSIVLLMQPIAGVGYCYHTLRNMPPGVKSFAIWSGIMVKVSDDWMP